MNVIRHCPAEAKKIAHHYAKIAVRSLYDELSLYPKPGLVSFIDSGAHSDMDGTLFFKSLFALRHYFFKVSLHAATGHSAPELVRHGLEAEARMLAITGGVNTHRGAIFALGIFCATSARLSSQNKIFDRHALHKAIINDWATYLSLHHRNDNTHGNMVRKQYAIADAKQLAINGYDCVFQLFDELSHIAETDKTFFGLLAYQRLLQCIDDINIVWRTGREGLAYARQQTSKAISADDREASIENALQLHQRFSQQNISPGGVADMLGVLFFLQRVFSGDLP